MNIDEVGISRRLVAYLKRARERNEITAEAPKSAAALATIARFALRLREFTENDVRTLLEYERAFEDAPIGSKGDSYFYALRSRELESTERDLMRSLDRIRRTLEAVRKVAIRMRANELGDLFDAPVDAVQGRSTDSGGGVSHVEANSVDAGCAGK